MTSSAPKNVANPSLYAKAKAKAKAKFDVYPSAYANGWMVRSTSGWVENTKALLAAR